jgi:hypothetical protein
MLKKNLFFYIVFTIILCVQYNYAQNYSNLLRTNNKAFKKLLKLNTPRLIIFPLQSKCLEIIL